MQFSNYLFNIDYNTLIYQNLQKCFYWEQKSYLDKTIIRKINVQVQEQLRTKKTVLKSFSNTFLTNEIGI